MEETIGECTNLHITYPALVLGYFAVVRGNRTIKDAIEAPTDDNAPTDSEGAEEQIGASAAAIEVASPAVVEKIKANDIAILGDGSVTDGLVRFHSALSEMTHRRGVRNEISRYESMALVFVEPKGAYPGSIFEKFPPQESPLHRARFFPTLYRRYDERFVLGAPLLADRGITTRREWSPDSPLITKSSVDASTWPKFDFDVRLSAP
jgi:hypothetical protein